MEQITGFNEKKHWFQYVQAWCIKQYPKYSKYSKYTPILTQNITFSKTLFFPSTIIEWNNLDHHLRKSENCSVFKSNIRKFIRPSSNSVYNCHNLRGICFITKLWLGLSHLKEHKFKHGFQDTLNPLCSWKWFRVQWTFSPLLFPIC